MTPESWHQKANTTPEDVATLFAKSMSSFYPGNLPNFQFQPAKSTQTVALMLSWVFFCNKVDFILLPYYHHRLYICHFETNWVRMNMSK